MKFFLWNQSLNSFISKSWTSLWYPIMKKRKIIMWTHVCLSWQKYFVSKTVWKKSFSYETKALISFIPIMRMCLWCPIMKREDIIIWIHVYPNWQKNFDSKIWWEVKFFLWNQSINSFIAMRKLSLWCPITKKKADYFLNSSLSKSTNER